MFSYFTGNELQAWLEKRGGGGGTGRELPPGSHKLHFLGGLGVTIYIENGSFYFC